jgi:multisubunit Na+/H+ antiporter MnhG subunit
MSLLVDNERTKLLANSIDRAATSCVTIGVLAPVAGFVYNVPGTQISLFQLVVGAILWIVAAAALHLVARLILKDLVQ